MDGVPPEVSTSTASLKVTVTPTVSPSLHCASPPAPLTLGVASTVGGSTWTCDELAAGPVNRTVTRSPTDKPGSAAFNQAL